MTRLATCAGIALLVLLAPLHAQDSNMSGA